MFEMNKIELANKELKKVRDFLENNKNAFQPMNLKLYDAYYYGSEEMKKDFPMCSKDNYDYFSDFCDISYDTFVEELTENYNIDFNKMRNQLGRTSSFYLHDNTVIYVDNYNIKYDETFYQFINEYSEANGYGIYTNFENGKIKIDEEYLNSIKDDEEEVENEIDYIINDFYNDFMEYCNDIVKVYNKIKDFKDNQIEYFKDYLECEEENIKTEKEQEKRKQVENSNICISIMNKYKISKEDMKLLKENIYDFEI